MSPRLYREECGAPGCGFVAGPSRDQNRVMRIVDEHRATAHALSEEPVRTFVTRRKTHGKYGMYKDGCRCHSCSEANLAYQRSVWMRRTEDDVQRRTVHVRQRRREATERRQAERRARVAALSQAMWSRAS